jgi:hypothetical protein
MSTNVYRRLIALLPETPTDVGEVIAITGDGVTVELLTGERSNVRGSASMGALVYVRDGAIQGPAPELTTVEIEV